VQARDDAREVGAFLVSAGAEWKGGRDGRVSRVVG
jgi:hypothetical protein